MMMRGGISKMGKHFRKEMYECIPKPNKILLNKLKKKGVINHATNV